MFELRDFFHLSQVATLVDQIVAGGPGLVVVAGPDARPQPVGTPERALLPSGRAAIFGMLVDRILAAHDRTRALVIAADREAYRPARVFRRRVNFALVQPPFSYTGRIAEALRSRPDLVILDHLTADTVPPALESAAAGLWVISQLNTAFHGAKVARHLLDLGASRQQLAGLRWVLSVQRIATLCPVCKQPALPDPDRLARLQSHYADLVRLLGRKDLLASANAGGTLTESGRDIARGSRQPSHPPDSGEEVTMGEIGTFFQAAGCPACQGSGRRGDLAIFDIFQADPAWPDPFVQPSQLAMQTYVLYLASLGELSFEDYHAFEADQFRRVFYTLAATERSLAEMQATADRQLAEQVSAHRVLEQRTRSLVSLHEIAQSLIAAVDLDELAAQVCRSAGELCGADRGVLYYLRPDAEVEVLASLGWDPDRLPLRMARSQVFTHGEASRALPFPNWPPGIPPRHADVEGANLRAGLYIPLVAQEALVGLMVVHSTRKPAFTPGEVALIQTFANQAALAIQRTGLVEQLRAKIEALEAAQAELVQKERLERELELARQVQQSLLPRDFPQVSGFQFAARYEPARQVGGDLYDVIPLDGERFGVAIADVSDKGMPAALYMALTRSLMLAEARRETSPGEVLRRINRLLLELSQPGMFVTVFYAVVDRSAGLLTYASAGHERPLLLRGGELRELEGAGNPLGILPEEEFEIHEGTVALQADDRLVLYTDGLADVVSRDGQLFDRARLKAIVQAHAGLLPADLCEAVFAALLAYQGGGEQFDDMAMLVMRVVPVDQR